MVYLQKLQDISKLYPNFFNFLAYKDFNVLFKETDTFFKAASTILNRDGRFLIQFHENEFHEYSNFVMKKYCGEIETIIDERGSFEILNDDPLEFKQIPNHVRFVVLSDPTKSN